MKFKVDEKVRDAYGVEGVVIGVLGEYHWVMMNDSRAPTTFHENELRPALPKKGDLYQYSNFVGEGACGYEIVRADEEFVIYRYAGTPAGHVYYARKPDYFGDKFTKMED